VEGTTHEKPQHGKLTASFDQRTEADDAKTSRLTVINKINGIKYFIDPNISVLPKRATKDKHTISKYKLHAANDTVITTYGRNHFADLLQEFSNITKPINFQVPKHGVTHHIIITLPSVAELAHRLSSEILRATRTQMQHMLDADLCKSSSSPWANPLHLVERKVIGEYVAIIED